MTQPDEKPVPPDDVPVHPAITCVRERFPAALLEAETPLGEATVVLKPDHLVEVCFMLRDEPTLLLDMLSSVTAVDWLQRLPRYDVVYHLLSLQTGHTLRLKARVGDDETENPAVPTVSKVWPAANWYEREVWDLFGIQFTDHPNLRRIEMPDDWVGHPLRKDYPLTGITLPEPRWGGQVPAGARLQEKTGRQTLRVIQPGGENGAGK